MASNLPRGSPTLPCFLRARSSCCPPLSFSPSQWRLGNRRGGADLPQSSQTTSLQPTACAVACSAAVQQCSSRGCLPACDGKRRRGSKGGGLLLLSALALHSPFSHPAPRTCTVYPCFASARKEGGWPSWWLSAEHAVRPWVEIDAKRVLILRGTRVDPVSAIVSPVPAKLRTDAPPRWLAGIPAAASVRWPVGLGCLFRTKAVRVCPARPSDESGPWIKKALKLKGAKTDGVSRYCVAWSSLSA